MILKSSKTAPIGQTIAANRSFLLPYVLFCLLFLSLILKYSNSTFFLFVNGLNSEILDTLFYYFTFLGDGALAAILIIGLLWVSYRDALTFLIITILITVIVSILKDHVFPELNRPVAYFGTTQYLHLVAGYKPPILSTFPSGHTATAFSIGLYLSILSKQNLTKYILFIVAFFVGYSRMYLSAHFPADVVGGATLGVITTLLCYYLSLNLYGAWGDKKIQYKPNFFSLGQKS